MIAMERDAEGRGVKLTVLQQGLNFGGEHEKGIEEGRRA